MTSPEHRSVFRSTRSLFALFVIATIAPLVLLAVLPLQMATSALGGQGTARVADTSSVASDTIRLQLDSLKAVVTSYSQRAELVEAAATGRAQNQSVRRALREFQLANMSVKGALLVDKKGTLLNIEPYSENLIGKDFSYRDYFTGAQRDNDAYVSEAFVSAGQGSPIYVAVAHDLTDGNGQFAGVLIAAVDVKSVFQTYVERFKSEHGVQLEVFDQKRHVVAGPDISKPASVVTDLHISDAQSGREWAGVVETDDETVVRAYAPVSGSGWVVSATVPKASAFAPIHSLEIKVIALSLVVGFVVLCALGMLARSVRAQAKTELRLRSSDQRTKAILETAHQGYCELDTEGRITDWNRQAEELLGWTRDEVMGKDAIELLVPAGRRDRVRLAFRDLLTANSTPVSHRETNVLLQKGKEDYLPVEMSSWVTVSDGHKSINLFVQDISDRMRLQKEQEPVVRRQKALVEELRAADKQKSDFISTISHELRTPLTSITGYLEMLQDGLGGELNESQQMMIDVVDRNSHRLLNLIEDVLALSRIESGSLKAERSETDVRSIITGTIATLLPSIHSKGLTLDADIANDTGSVVGDVDQLERAVLNIVNNAVKFTPEGGRISVNAYRTDEAVTISVSDTGVGIPVEEQPHLFSRFFRASTAQQSEIQGTGLGLTIVKSIVERHGGTVRLQSAVGVGTTVYVELPVSAAATAIASA